MNDLSPSAQPHRASFPEPGGRRDQVTLQYSHWFTGASTAVRGRLPAQAGRDYHPDEDMVSLSAAWGGEAAKAACTV